MSEEERKYLINKCNTLFEENYYLKQRIATVKEYIKEHNVLAVNKEYLPSGIERCCSAELLEILGDEENE